MISDHLNRTFKKLRLSVTPQCNFSCSYCVLDDVQKAPKFQRPSFFLSKIESIHKVSLLDGVRITGGEPLLYPYLFPLVEGIKKIGINNIGLTTNGFLLSARLDDLVEAGLQSVNISIDAFESEVFNQITKSNKFSVVQHAIKKAVDTGIKVKLNTVLLDGENEDQILPLLDFAFDLGIEVRFLELMKMGHLHEKRGTGFSKEKLLTIVEGKYDFVFEGRRKNATSESYYVPGKGRFGIIANDSAPFCSDCDRLRLDSNGRVYGCLSNAKGLELGEDVTESLQQALAQKQTERFEGSKITMKEIGG